MASAARTTRALLRLPTVRRLVGAFVAFSVVEWASWIGILIFAHARGGAAEAGVVACLVFVPSILVAPAASLFGDRRPRAHVLFAAYCLQAGSMLLTAVALAVAPALAAYAVATLAATTVTLARPAHAALMPEVVHSPDELAIGNAASGTAEGLGALLGPLLAGVLVSIGGPALVYGACAVLAAGSALAVFPIARAAAPMPSRRIERPGLFAELGAGVRAVAGDRRLLAVFAILSGAIALLGAFNVLMTVIAVDLLGGDESTIGYVAALAGLGSVAGAGATGVLMGRERLAGAYVGAAILFAATVATIGLGPAPAVILVCVALAGIGWAFVYVEALTLAQRLAGDDVMSRVFGVMESAMMASQSLGALAVPLVFVAFGIMPAFVVCGAALALIVVAAGPTLIHADRLVPHRVRQLRALRAVPMLGFLSAPVLERLATGSTIVSVDAGRAVVTEGELGDRFYVMLGGEVEATTRTGTKRRLTAGASFGEIALLHDIPRTATVRAVMPTELLALDRAPFLEALTGQPRSRATADTVSRQLLESDVARVQPPSA
ncbi:MAG: MFS transporter [Chloroflexota bacterium]